MIPDLHHAEPIPEAAKTELEKILSSGDLFRYHAATDAPVTLLEQEFATMLGTKFALAVSSCSAALFLTMRAMGLREGDRVLIPGFTFAAVPSAVVHAGCIPVLVEIGENYRLDLQDLAAKLKDDISAVLVSHMRGHTSDMDEIQRLCDAQGVPMIEDAAHSLGTLWNGRKIGTLGVAGCFSFQSYKLVNGGEGGIMITDDPDLFAQAVIMSGAYETNWKKHGDLEAPFAKYQNTLPLYNTRMSNLSATVIRPQLSEVARRAADGLRNHDTVADLLNQSKFVSVPPPLPQETRAPDSLQFNLIDFSDAEVAAFVHETKAAGVPVSVFGLSKNNARAFWNWHFLPEQKELPITRKVLSRACDLRLPAALDPKHLPQIAQVILSAVSKVKQLDQAA